MADTRFLREVSVVVGGQAFNPSPLLEPGLQLFDLAQEGVPVRADEPGSAELRHLYIHFRIRREARSTPAEGFIEIYNLTPRSEARIRERAERVMLKAGYEGRSEIIFDGDIRRVERVRQELDRITMIHIGGMVAKQQKATFNRTYQGDTPIRTIYTDAIATLGFDLGPFDLIPEDAVETDFRYDGPTGLLLDQLLLPYGLKWFEEDGVARVTAIGKSTDDRQEGVLITERTGMIGTPTVTDDGLRVNTLLDVRLKLDTKCRVESSILEDEMSGNQIYKVINLVHAGDNREGQFNTVADLRPVVA